MRPAPLFAVSAFALLAAAPASAQERYDFTPRVKAGDVFTTSLQGHDSLSFERPAMQGSTTTTQETVTTILEAECGRPVRFDVKTVKHEKSGDGLFSGNGEEGEPGPLQGITIRYERVGGDYEPMLLEGKLNAEVAEKLKARNVFPLKEDLLPTRPLAVGESQTLKDQKALSWLFKKGTSTVTFDEEPKVTLEKVATVDGARTAFLRSEIKGREQGPAEGGAGREERGSFQLRTTLLFDLDRGHVTRAEMRAQLQGPGSLMGFSTTIKTDTLIVERFRKN